MREAGRHRARASRGNTETSADFGCLNITFLASFSVGLLRPVHKQAPYPKARPGHGTLLRNQLAPGESRELSCISDGSSRTRFVYFSCIIRKMRREITRGRAQQETPTSRQLDSLPRDLARSSLIYVKSKEIRI